MTENHSRHRIAVIGGGITGLSAAHRLLELAPGAEVALLEASSRLGGVLSTERRGDFLIEHGPDMFITREPWALDLCQRIGFAEQLIGTNDTMRRAMVVRRGKLIPIPQGFTLMAPARIGPILRTPILSPWGKLRLGWEYVVPRRRDTSDESLASFARRRCGREAYDRLIQPLIGGIYTADPDQLSMQAAMPRFVKMEQQFGSLAKAMRRQSKQAGGKSSGNNNSAQNDSDSGVRYQAFLAPREGIGSLVTALANRLPEESIQLGVRVESLTPTREGKWLLGIADQGQLAHAEYDAVILALPAPAAGKLLQTVDQPLADDLTAIPYAGASVAILAYRRSDIDHPMDSFGAVVPHGEGRRILAISFASNKFPGRAPADHILLRVFVGGALQPELMQLDDEQTLQLVEAELRELLGVHGEPVVRQLARWAGKMPQYHVGHLERVARIEQRASGLTGLQLAGNAYHGVGIPFCVHDGEQAAEQIVESLNSPTS